MKNKIKILGFSLFFAVVSGVAYAGPGHDHSHGAESLITAEDALEAASGAIDALIAQQYLVGGAVLPESWKTATNNTIETENPNYIIVRVAHPTENKSLYLLFSTEGELYDANFTGQFEGLE